MSLQLSATQVANFFIGKALEEDVGLTHMKLQKLVYIAFGWSLAVFDRKLFNEPIMAWQHGPVITSIYHTFKSYGQNNIHAKASEYDFDKGDFCVPEIPPDDEDAIKLLDKVWAVYKRFSAWSLRNKTHEKDTPWSQAYDGSMDKQIDNARIKAHFEQKIAEYLQAAA